MHPKTVITYTKVNTSELNSLISLIPLLFHLLPLLPGLTKLLRLSYPLGYVSGGFRVNSNSTLKAKHTKLKLKFLITTFHSSRKIRPCLSNSSYSKNRMLYFNIVYLRLKTRIVHVIILHQFSQFCLYFK